MRKLIENIPLGSKYHCSPLKIEGIVLLYYYQVGYKTFRRLPQFFTSSSILAETFLN